MLDLPCRQEVNKKQGEIIMKKITKKLVTLLCVSTMVVVAIVGCGSKDKEKNEKKQEVTNDTEVKEEEKKDDVVVETKKELSGTITLAGSTSMEKLSNAIAEVFMEKYQSVSVLPEFTGSSAGIEALLNASVQIGNTSRNLKDSEIEAGAVENIVAIDGIAVVVDVANSVTSLTKDQLISIYKGEIKNWSEVGGENAPIVVVGREAGSGTRGAFEEILKVEDVCAYASELDSTGAVMAKVASTKGAIGYVSLDVVDDSVNALALDEVDATVENIKAGNYFLSRPFVMATKGALSEQNELVQELFAFLASEEGKAVITKVGLITVD